MSLEFVPQTIEETPLAELVETSEESVRLLAERLSDRGLLTEDQVIRDLLAGIRVRLLVATKRLKSPDW